MLAVLQAPDDAAHIAFLRDRCTRLQRALGSPGDPALLDTGEDAAIAAWTRILVREKPWPAEVQEVLDELYWLQARVVERLDRGGVADICLDVEFLVRAVLIDRLQHLTHDAVIALS